MSDWAKPFFDGRVAIIAGGTSGIGLALAKGFAAAGARVVAAGLDVPSAPEPGVEFRHLDVTDADAVASFAASFSRADVLVNSAGIIRRKEEFALENFEAVLDVNLTGAMRVASACKPKLAGGAILNIASLFSFAGAAHAPAYAASKGGIAQLTKSLSIAWAADGIRVNAIAPGWIETPFTEPLRADPARNAAILARTPMGRWGRPDDLVDAALFLCSPLAGFITGILLPVDGGYLAA